MEVVSWIIRSRAVAGLSALCERAADKDSTSYSDSTLIAIYNRFYSDWEELRGWWGKFW